MTWASSIRASGRSATCASSVCAVSAAAAERLGAMPRLASSSPAPPLPLALTSMSAFASRLPPSDDDVVAEVVVAAPSGELDDAPLSLEEDETAEADARRFFVAPAAPGAIAAARSRFLGRYAALMSPMPTKKSSARTTRRIQPASLQWGKRSQGRTRDDLDEVGRPVPHIATVVNDDNHARVAGEEALETLERQACTWPGAYSARIFVELKLVRRTHCQTRRA